MPEVRRVRSGRGVLMTVAVAMASVVAALVSAPIQGGGRTHTFDRTDVPMTQQTSTIVKTVIGSDVWIGTGATILANVAAGTVVGAGSVVTKEFPERSVVVGAPARVLRSRSEN